ncbi:FAD/NAD(P)-binding protein [Streptomyces cylindrosporus]|uniref:FAD/NAD(P)-binding protein n=1 Tax=Streptomyces cylindrosporus TaxID=2927583 RepID=A0ABS9YM68_9ACTN|nr:FAD/NAD(P)-binding protein [Streptomyces cylindrosporus]MCI3278250.1 FAD/NAD(P)-binding protein [Streptomyces cylindrosporus]
MTAVPVPHRVVARRAETADTVTLRFEPVAAALPEFLPGQFAMVHSFGRGEIPVSVSSVQATGGLAHTVRSVGAVSDGLCSARVGDVVGIRGPYGTPWEPERARGRDVVVVAGGIGFAPLRPLILAVLAEPAAYRRVNILIGARTPGDLIARAEVASWATAYTGITVDQPEVDWRGDVGVVTQLLGRAHFEPEETTAFVCGPEPMIRATSRELAHLGVPRDQVQVSLERNMRCATGHCGHCQLGPLLVCQVGPVVDWERAEPLLSVREL